MEDALQHTWRRAVRRRLLVVAAIFGLWAVAVQVRLVWLQVVRHDYYVQRAERQQQRTLTLPAERGDIRDRDGRMLATSADAATIYAVPTEIDDPVATTNALCRVLDGCRQSREWRDALLERLSRRRAFAYVKRQVSPDEARAVKALDLAGIGFSTESRRFYPNRELLAPVLGYVGVDNKGLGGLEQTYDRVIRGEEGMSLVFTDARRHAYDRVDRPPTVGASLELTIDAVLQHAVERELRAGVEAARAEGGVAIVMDPWTGEVLAMASLPTFNPNVYGEFDPESRRNRAVMDIYEPGSTFKTITASAAFEEGVLTPDTPIDCAPGYITIGTRRVNDMHRYGVLSFAEVLAKSSNVGAIKAGFRVGGERMLRYVRRFGFGTRLSRDLPGEQAGIVWPELNDSALASVSMGYQIGVTPLQMAAAVSSIANGGRLFRPRVVRAVVRDGVRTPVEPDVIRQTVSPRTAAIMTSVMEGVVDHGTARSARIDGYTIAGKTGTSEKIENGVYVKQKHMASFVGFIPSRSPAVTVLVVIDTPRAIGRTGGVVAAPVFRRISEVVLRQLAVPRNLNPEKPVLVARRQETPVTPVKYGAPQIVPSAPVVPARDGLMPDLSGLSARSAIRQLARLGLAPSVEGLGVVAAQHPAPGTPLDPGTRVRLELERLPLRTPREGAGLP
jgi:cell division protein FtsI/penicillin-binding protein 2